MLLRQILLARIYHELLSRDHETGNPLAGLSGAQRALIRWTCHLATAGCWFRGVPVWYVAGTDTRGRQEGRTYPWSQQVIHDISGLCLKYDRNMCRKLFYPSRLLPHYASSSKSIDDNRADLVSLKLLAQLHWSQFSWK